MLGITFTFVLLGVASAPGRGGVPAIALVLAASLAFHVAVYASNDIADLHLDRGQPRRAASPLVSGAVTPATVGAVAGAAALVALGLAAAAGPDTLGWMAGALALLGIYNLYGKRTSLPPLTDVAQGLGWAALVAYAAFATGMPGEETAWVAAYVVLAIVLVNGIHGGLRDLRSDLSGGANTTAILLGVRPAPGGGAHVTPRAVAYALIVQAGMVAVLLAGLVDQGATARRLAVGAACAVASIALLAYALAVADSPARSWPVGLAHVLLSLALPVVLVAERLDPPLGALLVVLYAVPSASVVRRARAAAVPQRRLA